MKNDFFIEWKLLNSIGSLQHERYGQKANRQQKAVLNSIDRLNKKKSQVRVFRVSVKVVLTEVLDLFIYLFTFQLHIDDFIKIVFEESFNIETQMHVWLLCLPEAEYD